MPFSIARFILVFLACSINFREARAVPDFIGMECERYCRDDAPQAHDDLYMCSQCRRMRAPLAQPSNSSFDELVLIICATIAAMNAIAWLWDRYCSRKLILDNEHRAHGSAT